MKIPTLEQLLNAGVHFGHKVSKWHPKMAPFIYGNKNGIHIINLEKTKTYLEKALDYAQTLAKQGKIILFVGTKEQAQKIVKKSAEEAGMPYVTEHWVGGMITNFTQIQRRLNYLKKLEEDKKRGQLKKYTKKEQADFADEIKKLNVMFGGLKQITKTPDAIFIVDIKREKTAIREARKKGLPIIALTDTNVNPELVTHPIPANDDALKSLELIITTFGVAVKEGRAAVEKGDDKAS